MATQSLDDAGRLKAQCINTGGTAFEDIQQTSGSMHVKVTSGTSISVAAAGDVANDAADSGNPVKTGGVAADIPTTPQSAVSAGDRVNAMMDLNGRQAVIQDLVQAVPDAAAPAQAIQAGGVANATAPTPDEGDLGALSMDLNSQVRVTQETVTAAHDAAAPANVLMAGAVANAVADTPDEGDASRFSMNLNSEVRVTNESVEGTHDSAKPARAMMVAAACQATADTPDDGDIAELSVNTGNELRVIQENLTGTHDAAAPTKAIMVAAIANATADTPDEGDASFLSVDLNSQLRVKHDDVLDVARAGEALELAASAARTANGNGSDFDVGGHDTVAIVLDVTAAATAAGDTLDVSVEAKFGSTYIEIVHFTQVLGDGGAKRFVAIIKTEQLAIADYSTATLSAGQIRHFLTETIRAKWAIVDAGGGTQSFTFSVNAYAK